MSYQLQWAWRRLFSIGEKTKLADISNAKCFIYQSSSKTADVWSAIKENQNWPITSPIFHKLTSAIKIQFCKIMVVCWKDRVRNARSSWRACANTSGCLAVEGPACQLPFPQHQPCHTKSEFLKVANDQRIYCENYYVENKIIVIRDVDSTCTPIRTRWFRFLVDL